MTLQPLWPLWVVIAMLVPLGAAIALAVLRPSRRASWLRRAGVLAMVALAAAGPSVLEERTTTARSTIDVFFVVDLTGSMAAEDYLDSATRLSGATADVVQITEAFPSARYSVIGWDSQSTVRLPLTTDANAVISWADTATQELSAYSSGSQLDRPLGQLTQAVTSAAERHPEDVRLVYFLSDGENTDGSGSSADAVLASYEGLAPYIDGGAVLGYGTDDGAPMRRYDLGVDPADSEYITDVDGSVAISRIDEQTLRTIAGQLGVSYAHRTNPGNIGALVGGVDAETIVEDGRRVTSVYRPVVWPLALVALGLLSWEVIALMGLLPPARSEWEEDQ